MCGKAGRGYTVSRRFILISKRNGFLCYDANIML